jgi:hypothetical protein
MTLVVLVSSLLPGNTIAVAELGEEVEVELPGGSGHERRLLSELLLEARLRRHLTPLQQQQRRRPEFEWQPRGVARSAPRCREASAQLR